MHHVTQEVAGADTDLQFCVIWSGTNDLCHGTSSFERFQTLLDVAKKNSQLRAFIDGDIVVPWYVNCTTGGRMHHVTQEVAGADSFRLPFSATHNLDLSWMEW